MCIINNELELVQAVKIMTNLLTKTPFIKIQALRFSERRISVRREKTKKWLES